MTTTRPTQPPMPTELPEILEREVLLARNLLLTLQEEQKALKKMDIQLLAKVSKMKELLTEQLQGLDGALRTAMTLFAAHHSVPIPTDRDLKLGELLPLCSDKVRAPLSQHRQELATLRQAIHTLTYVNQQFTIETLRFLNDTIALVTRSTTHKQPGLYNTKGAANVSYNRPSIFSREV